jgi:hypothetical protein
MYSEGWLTDVCCVCLVQVDLPGHRGLGFCFVNHAAGVAMHAIDHWRLRRVSIIDFDVHHGELIGSGRGHSLSDVVTRADG